MSWRLSFFFFKFDCIEAEIEMTLVRLDSEETCDTYMHLQQVKFNLDWVEVGG